RNSKPALSKLTIALAVGTCVIAGIAASVTLIRLRETQGMTFGISHPVPKGDSRKLLPPEWWGPLPTEKQDSAREAPPTLAAFMVPSSVAANQPRVDCLMTADCD